MSRPRWTLRKPKAKLLSKTFLVPDTKWPQVAVEKWWARDKDIPYNPYTSVPAPIASLNGATHIKRAVLGIDNLSGYSERRVKERRLRDFEDNRLIDIVNKSKFWGKP